MADGTMMQGLSRVWGWIVLRGLVALLFGIAALAWPSITLSALVLVWGIYALLDGLAHLVAGFNLKVDGKPMWPLVLAGLVGVAVGVLIFLKPQSAALALLWFIGAWAILIGLLQITAAIALRKMIANEWWMAVAGLLSVAFGVLMFARPSAGGLAVVVLIAWYAIVYGIVLLMLGFRIKGLTAQIPRPA